MQVQQTLTVCQSVHLVKVWMQRSDMLQEADHAVPAVPAVPAVAL